MTYSWRSFIDLYKFGCNFLVVFEVLILKFASLSITLNDNALLWKVNHTYSLQIIRRKLGLFLICLNIFSLFYHFNVINWTPWCGPMYPSYSIVFFILLYKDYEQPCSYFAHWGSVFAAVGNMQPSFENWKKQYTHIQSNQS